MAFVTIATAPATGWTILVTVLLPLLLGRFARKYCQSLTEPHAPKQTVVTNEIVIKGCTNVKHEQTK
jgi:predicted Na+-dependent transporter